MDLYARALEERGIPFEITGSDAFSESEEIHEITNLAMALNDPDNAVYTVAVLRGVFCGASDEDLVEFKRRGGRFNYLSPGLDILKSQHVGATYVLLGLQRMKTWRDLTLRLPASAALHKIFEDSGIINYLVSKEMGSSRAGNMLKLLEIVRNEERKGETAFARVVKLLEELAEEREIEEISLTPARENAVRLMNLHKAKGLEAPVVFLANPSPSRDHEVDKHVVRLGAGACASVDKIGDRHQFPEKLEPVTNFHVTKFQDSRPKGYFAFHKPGTFQAKGPLLSQPVGWEAAAEEEKKYQEAEEQRLMYVAATRARDMLVISTYGGSTKNKPWKTLDDALADVPGLGWPGKEGPDHDRGRLKRELEEQGVKLSLAEFDKLCDLLGSEDAQKKPESAEASKVRKTKPLSKEALGRLQEAAQKLGRIREKIAIPKLEVEHARKRIEANYETAAEPTYQVETVTSLAKKEQEAPARRHDTGLGLSWGRLVHQILEAVGSGRLRIPALEAKGKPESPSPAPSPIKREGKTENGVPKAGPSPLVGEGRGEGDREEKKGVPSGSGIRAEGKGIAQTGVQTDTPSPLVGEGVIQTGVQTDTPSPLVGEGRGEGDRVNLELFVENLLAAEEGDYSDKEKLIAHVKSIVESDFWRRIMRAECRYFEIPFSIKTSQQELEQLGGGKAYPPFGLGPAKKPKKSGKEEEAGKGGKQTVADPKSHGGKGGLPVILSGTIDLVFWESGLQGKGDGSAKSEESPADTGWVIADYKTDTIRPQLIDDDLADLVKMYAPQIRLYARFWSRTTGEVVKEAGLYFTSIDRWIKIPPG